MQRAKTLSGGEQQMLAIGRALMTNPDCLIMDEPSEGLAPIVIQGVWEAVGKLKDFDFSVKVAGGGIQGQAIAIRHGIARTLVIFDKDIRATLKPFGYLTRDPRRKERKKPGLKRARRGPQWAKR